MEFKHPPLLYNEEGELRKVGFELEFAEVNLATATQIITDLFGGQVNQINKYYAEVEDTDLGNFTVKLDARVLHEKTYQKVFEALGIDVKTITLGDQMLLPQIEKLLETVASKIIPYEIVTPPLPINHLQQIEELRLALYHKNALGTKAAMGYAFATHINPEIPGSSVDVLLRYLQAFVLLHPWLLKVSKVDLSRRLSTFINAFPHLYMQKILQPGYQPDLSTFINDYYQHNADRNRALDLYPVLAWLRKDKVDHMPGIGDVKSRPTFHYRLPNCLVDDPDWRVAQEWNYWVEVEKLANDAENLHTLRKEYLKMEQKTLLGFQDRWYHRIEEWLK